MTNEYRIRYTMAYEHAVARGSDAEESSRFAAFALKDENLRISLPHAWLRFKGKESDG